MQSQATMQSQFSLLWRAVQGSRQEKLADLHGDAWDRTCDHCASSAILPHFPLFVPSLLMLPFSYQKQTKVVFLWLNH